QVRIVKGPVAQLDRAQDVKLEEELAEQMSAFKVNKNQIKQLILRQDLELDPDTWDDEDKLGLARAVRKDTKPIVIAANKMDLEKSQENFEEIKNDEEYEHLEFIPCSAHAEKALKNADEKELIEYWPGNNDFEILQEDEMNDQQKKALEDVREFIEEFGGTGVQEVMEKALFDVLDVIAVFPGGADGLGDKHGNILPDCFLIPGGSTAEDFAYEIHSDIGDGFIHAIDCRDNRHFNIFDILKTDFPGLRTLGPRLAGVAGGEAILFLIAVLLILVLVWLLVAAVFYLAIYIFLGPYVGTVMGFANAQAGLGMDYGQWAGQEVGGAVPSYDFTGERNALRLAWGRVECALSGPQCLRELQANTVKGLALNQ
ncbi:translation-associated GTPase, partial [Candidatus Haloredivivus sp. G17]